MRKLSICDYFCMKPKKRDGTSLYAIEIEGRWESLQRWWRRLLFDATAMQARRSSKDRFVAKCLQVLYCNGLSLRYSVRNGTTALQLQDFVPLVVSTARTAGLGL
jgi:hypothetical protein